jgi:nucleoside-diphosphate-sugar epimerase
MSERRLLCFGYGYTARHLATELGPDWHVAGTVRSAQARDRLRADGIDAVVFDGDPAGKTLARLIDRASHILISVPPDADGDPVLQAFSGRLAGARHIAWAGYLSTTGVYGDHAGGWVDEDTPPAPANIRSERRVAAEQAWLRLHRESGLPVHIFRLAGIYGPGRSVIDNLRAGTARRIVKPGQVFSRIHVTDLARILEASMNRPDPGALYNVCDDEAAATSDVIAYAAQLLGMEAPPEIPLEAAELSEMAASFYGECKRVRNERMKRELGIELRYPTYREGLAALAGE